MKLFFKFFAVTLFLLISTQLSAEQKVAFIDMKYVLNNSKAGKGAQDYLKNSFQKNQKKFSGLEKDLKNRESFSRWMYNLHELVNKMLGKKSGLTYAAVRERHEHFRSRCTKKDKKARRRICKTKKKEKGCTTPLYGKKAKCVIKIVPQETKCNTFQMDKKCVKERK